MEKEYQVVDIEKYYRKDVFKHFSKEVNCSFSITSDVDVTSLVAFCKAHNLKFYVVFLYLLSKALNSSDDYKYHYDFESHEVRLYKAINPAQYIFHDDSKTFTIAYTHYDPDFKKFYENAIQDIEKAKKSRGYGLDEENHPNWFDASYISWINYSSLHIELPDGYLFLNPIVNWGRYALKEGKLMLPLSLRMNHAIADGYQVSSLFVILQGMIDEFAK